MPGREKYSHVLKVIWFGANYFVILVKELNIVNIRKAFQSLYFILIINFQVTKRTGVNDIFLMLVVLVIIVRLIARILVIRYAHVILMWLYIHNFWMLSVWNDKSSKLYLQFFIHLVLLCVNVTICVRLTFWNKC